MAIHVLISSVVGRDKASAGFKEGFKDYKVTYYIPINTKNIDRLDFMIELVFPAAMDRFGSQ